MQSSASALLLLASAGFAAIPLAAQTELYQTSLYNDPSLVAYWRLEGNVADSKGANNGTAFNLAYGTQYGKFGQGAFFNGIDGYFTADSSVLNGDYNQAFTFSAWVRSTKRVALNFFSKFDPANLYRGKTLYGHVAQPGDISMELISDNYTLPATAIKVRTAANTGWDDGNWHLITATYDGSGRAAGMAIYLDGVSQGLTVTDDTLGGNSVTNAIPLYIGQFGPANSTLFYSGDMDDVAVFSRALSPAEVAALAFGAGTISVTTNSLTATFSITGPITFSGSGTSATFSNAPAGTYTITFDAVMGYITPPPQTQTLISGSVISFTGTYNASRVTLTSITGWTFGDLVVNAQWSGQPPQDKTPNTNIYDLFYAIDYCQKSSPCAGLGADGPQQITRKPVWQLNGSGFCPPASCAGQKGSVVFSDPSIIVPSSVWTNTTIRFTPSFAPTASFQYTTNPNVSITLTTPDGLLATFPLPTPGGKPATPGVIATIDGRGYGQCTWYVANQRLAQGLPIPVPAYYILGTIDANYSPQQWDVIDFTKAHTAIIISPVDTKRITYPDGSATIIYTFTIGEMNVGTCPQPGQPCKVSPWSEQPSTVSSAFIIAVSPSGTQSVQQPIYSLDTGSRCQGPNGTHLCPATHYFR